MQLYDAHKNLIVNGNIMNSKKIYLFVLGQLIVEVILRDTNMLTMYLQEKGS